ncbi:MAG: single-stranded-DNA-specific exonuclease RecJ [Verrucomicrobia bacterium]|nr:single-stranded-DNA-specific exonuclease RecJ [Verrucomicrobiota bacterium]
MGTGPPSDKLWKTLDVDREAATLLSQETDLPAPIAALCIHRGFSDAAGVDRLLRPRLSDFSDPNELPDMPVAVERVWDAIDAAQLIVVYGDYDVDGITSTALLYRVLTRLGASVRTFLPDRESEGYGFTTQALRRCLAEQHPGLIVTVDCGSCSTEAVAFAREKGIDVIVTDHHELATEPADAFALVNPKRSQIQSQQVLAGVGVAFKLCHSLVKRGRESHPERVHNLDLRDYLDLIAVGTVADIVPLTGENRALVRHGLRRLQTQPQTGLHALREAAGGDGDGDGEADTYLVGFVLGPRLNAAGRLGSAMASLELLMTEDTVRAAELARELDQSNRERRRIEGSMAEAATKSIDESFDAARDFGLVIGEEGWHVGVVGIVASRLAQRYRRPSLVIAFGNDGQGRGSGRSIEGFNLLQALETCADLFVTYGGHAMAAGFTIERTQLAALQQRFNKACSHSLKDRDLRATITIQAWLDSTDADMRFCESLEQLKPFGAGYSRPIWGLRSLHVVGEPRVVGTRHLKLRLAAGGTEWDAIAFGMADRELPDGPIDVACAVEKNSFRGRDSVQLNIQDFRPAE